MRTIFSVGVVILSVLVSIWLVVADPVEMHARREVERRQQLADNSSITASTLSTSLTLLPTTSASIPPTTNSNSPTTLSTPAGTSSSASTPTFVSIDPSGSAASPSLSTSFSRSIRTFTTDVVTTINGVAITIPITSTSETLIPTTINLQTQSSSGGLTDNSKKIVIGVLVGVGGAAIVALIAVLVWRHMRREKERKEYETSPNLTYFGDEPEEGHSATPDSNKEGLHRSPTRVNAAANF